MAAIAEGERVVRTGSRWYAGLTSPALWTLIALIVIWEIAVQVTHVPVYILPAPSRIADEFVAYWPRLVVNGGVTVMEILIGFVISILIGAAFGYVSEWIAGALARKDAVAAAAAA